mgnify:CR=1 FL=1
MRKELKEKIKKYWNHYKTRGVKTSYRVIRNYVLLITAGWQKDLKKLYCI